MNNLAVFEPVTDLGKSILQSSENAAHGLASRTIDAAKLHKPNTEEMMMHNPAPIVLDKPKEMPQPTINKDHPHLRSVNKTYTQCSIKSCKK